MVVASPSPRRVKTPSWLDIRLVLGVALVVGSVLVGAKVLANADRTYQMLAVSRDMAAGSIMRAQDVTTVAVRVPDRSRYLDAGSEVAGRQLNRAVSRGELLPASALATPPALTTVTVPLVDGAAPTLSVGQRIELWLSTRSCASIVLVADAAVQGVDESDGTSFASRGGQNITLSLPPQLAGRVVTALALDGASIRAGILSGPMQVGMALPELDACSVAAP